MRPPYPGPVVPKRETIVAIVNRFQETGSVNNWPLSGRPSNDQAAEDVDQLITDNPSVSMRQLSQQVGQCKSFVHNVCRRMLKLYPYRVQLHHALQPSDFTQRVTFCEWIRHKAKVTSEPDFLSNIFFSDEAHFWLNGYVNSQNYRIWGSENPHVCSKVSSLQAADCVGYNFRKPAYWKRTLTKRSTAASFKKTFSQPFVQVEWTCQKSGFSKIMQRLIPRRHAWNCFIPSSDR